MAVTAAQLFPRDYAWYFTVTMPDARVRTITIRLQSVFNRLCYRKTIPNGQY